MIINIKPILVATVLSTLGALPIAITAAKAQPVPVLTFGAGNSSCGTWTQTRSGPVTLKTVEYVSWVLGFMSGRSTARMYTAPKSFDSGAVLGWMDNYCRQNPLQSILAAAIMLDLEVAPINR